MKAKSKSAKKVKKKPAARKKVTTTARKKKAVGKAAKKVTTAKKARKAAPKQKAKKPATRKKTAPTTQKKKTIVKPVKPSATKNKPVSAARPVAIIEETIVTVTTALPGNGFPIPASTGVLIGKVVHYYNHSNVAIIELDTGYLRVGDTIHIKGHTTDFEQVVESIEIEHQNIETAETGQTVGVKVRDMVREHDRVYRKAE